MLYQAKSGHKSMKNVIKNLYNVVNLIVRGLCTCPRPPSGPDRTEHESEGGALISKIGRDRATHCL